MDQELKEQLEQIAERNESMEKSMKRMEKAFTEGMQSIADAVQKFATVATGMQENREEHIRLHQRINDTEEKHEELHDILTEVKTRYDFCCGTDKPKKEMNPIVVAIITFAVTAFAASYAFLLLVHAGEMRSLMGGK